MKDTFGKKIYKCFCGAKVEEFVWESQLKEHTFECPSCSHEIAYPQLEVKKKVESAAIRTPTKNR
jgi:DNA-directed RNA polymerase subunit RPC12/RpoP